MKRRTVVKLSLSRAFGVDPFTIEVPATAVRGSLCVTRLYEYNDLFDCAQPVRGRYRVSHIPSGWSVFPLMYRMTKSQAVAEMRKLAALDGWDAPAAEVKKNKALKTAVRDIEAELEKQ